MSPQSHVHCTVENCKWFEQPNLCVAEKLLVVSDEMADELANEIDVEQTNQIVNEQGLSTVSDCTQSCCKTFVPRDEYNRGQGDESGG